jgi:hypothetical protein
MTSKRQKGNQFQDWIANWFKKTCPECAVHNQKTVARMVKVRDKKTWELKDIWVSQRNDIFGCVDLIVVCPGSGVRFIQATLDTSVTKRQKELMVIPWTFGHCSVELWQKKKAGEVHIKVMVEGGEFRDYGKIIRGKLYRLEEGLSQDQASLF